jgi:hypothetical protein
VNESLPAVADGMKKASAADLGGVLAMASSERELQDRGRAQESEPIGGRV